MPTKSKRKIELKLNDFSKENYYTYALNMNIYTRKKAAITGIFGHVKKYFTGGGNIT